MAPKENGAMSTDSIEGPLSAGPAAWQRTWHEVIFEAETPAGKCFDVVLLLVIVASIAAVMLESIESLQPKWGTTLSAIEWIITLLFSLEFLARLACVAKPTRYAYSFFGIVDIVSILPSYLALFFTGANSLMTIRTLRLLRVFRVLKMGHHLKEANTMLFALRKSWPKITVFLTVILCSIVISGTLMYLIEGGSDSGFDNIPASIYWAIVTITTVGYGDIAPVTSWGKFTAAFIMLLGYAIIIVPTGIFTAEIIRGDMPKHKLCDGCRKTHHASDAKFCAACGAAL